MNGSSFRWQFNIRRILIAMTLVAFCLVLFPLFNIGSQVLLAIFGVSLILGSTKTRCLIALLLPILYLPYAWLLFDPPYGDYRLNYWIGSWLSLPMRIPARLATDSEFLLEIISSSATVILFFGLIYIMRHGRLAITITAIGILMLSVMNSIVLHAVYSV